MEGSSSAMLKLVAATGRLLILRVVEMLRQRRDTLGLLRDGDVERCRALDGTAAHLCS
jgi:hypothetical protein